MEAKFNKLKQQYIKSKTVEEKNKIKKQIQSLNDSNTEAFGEIILYDIKETNISLNRLLKSKQ